MLDKSRLMPISYYNPKQEIRLSAYADTIILEPDGQKQHLRAIRFGGYPEMVRAMSDAIYAGATLETEFAGETAMLTCEPKKYECHLSHDGIYAEATILSLDDEDAAAKKDEEAQADGQTNVELPLRKCVLFCPAGDRRALFEALDRKTAVPLIPEFQDYVLDELQRRRFLKPLRVISIRERLEAWLLLCKNERCAGHDLADGEGANVKEKLTMARMKSAQTVYYGPAYSGYPSVGSVSANESIDFLWTEGAWCYIRYSVSGTANKKCGYVPETAVNHANESPLVLFKRLLNRFVYGN